ncbi:hypothetical protein Tco_1494033 [Tanacetum coccineum]
MRETNAELTTELARYKNQENCFEINQEKYDKLERCYQKSVYQEQCLTKNINALHLSSAKMITTLNEKIANLNNHLSKEKSTVSYLQQKKKKLKDDFKIREDELLDKQIQLENKIKELDNILKMALGYQNSFYLKQAQQKQQSLYNGKVLLEKHDPPVVYDSKETMKQLNKEIKMANYAKINQLSKGFVSQKAKLREELYFSNTSKTASVSKSVSKLISIPNEEFSDDTSPKVDASLDKHKALEFKIKCLLRAVVTQDIMSIVKNHSVVDTSDLQTELERTKERFENCINDCGICKYDKISYAKAYNDTQQKIERLQAQLGDQKGKSKDTPCVSNTLDLLSRKLENENMELEFQVSKQKDTTKGKKSCSYKVELTLGQFDTVSQPHVITKKDVNSDSNGLSSTGVDDNIKYLILFSNDKKQWKQGLKVKYSQILRSSLRRNDLEENMEMEPDIENMTMNEYFEYEAAKERQLWTMFDQRSTKNINEADVDSFHQNKSKTFSYPYSHNLTPPHPYFLPVQSYPNNYLVSTNESNDADIENITIAEYNLYVLQTGLKNESTQTGAENIKRMGHDIVQDSIWEHDDDSEEDQEEDGDDEDTFDMWDITVEDVERIRNFFNVPDEIDKIVQHLIPEPIHTTPPNDDYVAPTTKSILDKLLEELGDEILNITMVDDEADFNHTKD